jgi:hypothetical protein
MLISGHAVPPGARRDEAYLRTVSDTIAAIPYRVGSWIGADVEPQRPAIEMLRPNRLLQRRYVSTDGAQVMSLLVVHCGDARDMQGHYPPICYPAQGWVISSRTPIAARVGAVTVPAMVYTVTTLRREQERRMTIINFFVVPSEGEPFTPDMDGVNRASAASARSALGALQVQLIVHEEATPERMAGLLDEIGSALAPTLRSVTNDPGA